jgi:hypothetical protein
MTSRIALAVAVAVVSVAWGVPAGDEPKVSTTPEFRHHFVTKDLPSRNGQGDYGLTALADLDGDGDLDIARGDTWFENKDGKGLVWAPHRNLPMGRRVRTACVFGRCLPTSTAMAARN